MLPECCTLEDVHKVPCDSDTTLAKRRSFADQYLLLCRQDCTEFIENTFSSSNVEPVKDVIVIQDERFPPLSTLLSRIDATSLSSLAILDCWLKWTEEQPSQHLQPQQHYQNQLFYHQHQQSCNEQNNVESNQMFDVSQPNLPSSPPPYHATPGIDIFSNLNLQSLVLSHTHLNRLPLSLFEMTTLEILKVDHNNLEEVPTELGQLVNLKIFCCDSQKPRLRSIPVSINRLQRLQVLSFSNNKIENISWLASLPNLRVILCNRNFISKLPVHLSNLKHLSTLDISHNRIEHIPSVLIEVLSQLNTFEFFNISLRPKSIRHDKLQLFTHLDMEYYLQSLQQQPQSYSSRLSRGVTIAVVGESHSGKVSLVEALKDDKGISRSLLDVKQTTLHKSYTGFQSHMFDMRSSDASVACHISAIVVGNDVLDNYTQNLKVDLYVLTFDMTSLEMHNGSQHLFARHVSRLQMWMQALFELSPETPVLLVGTHAELVKSSSSMTDIWDLVETLLDHSRPHHTKKFAEKKCSYCLICNPKTAGRKTGQGRNRIAISSAGFVDLTSPHFENVALINGHQSSQDNSNLISNNPQPTNITINNSNFTAKIHHFKYPHIAAYYEIDSKKPFPKDSKKANASIDQLKTAISRLASLQNTSFCVPNIWLTFVRHLSAIKDESPNMIGLPFDEIIPMARSFEIPPTQVNVSTFIIVTLKFVMLQVPIMLQYFHERGSLVYFHNHFILSRVVIINTSWFVTMIKKAQGTMDKKDRSSLHQALSDKELDKLLAKSSFHINFV